MVPCDGLASHPNVYSLVTVSVPKIASGSPICVGV